LKNPSFIELLGFFFTVFCGKTEQLMENIHVFGGKKICLNATVKYATTMKAS
jgi:hypothetical protein